MGKKPVFLDEVRRRGQTNLAGTLPQRSPAKPHIDDVELMFHTCREAVGRAVRRHISRSPEMGAAIDDARADLKAKLHAVGLAERIDWRPRE